MKSVVLGGKKYIRNGDGVEEVYDLLEDPAERHNLADELSPEELERLRQALDTSLRPSDLAAG